jgi:hypothetical protein
MAITNGYTTLNAIKTFLSIADNSDDTLLEGMVEAASRSIDRIANRRFYLDSTASARQYRAYNNVIAYVDDIGTTASLAVAIDDDGDGVFEISLTRNTDYLLDP